MTEQKIQLIDYKEVLKELESQECHLLLGNGFNNQLDTNLSYNEIFNQMAKKHAVYHEAKDVFETSNNDIEALIGKLRERLNPEDTFLKNLVSSKIKTDFMVAVSEISKKEVSKIYKKNNYEIYSLLQNFTNFFTLNYDPFLYLLLMKYTKKQPNDKKIKAVTQRSWSKSETFKNLNDELYNLIKNTYEQVVLKDEKISGTDLPTVKIDIPFGNLTQTLFGNLIKKGLKNKFKSDDIKEAVNRVWDEKSDQREIENNDGFLLKLFGDEKEFHYDPNNKKQNVFYLHGAFHIYQDGEIIKKITKTNEKALYDEIFETISEESKKIICIFTPKNKTTEIESSDYLKNTHQKLKTLSGAVVIIGSAVSENDAHIYSSINDSQVHTIYFSTSKNKLKERKENLIKYFPKKEIKFFDYNTIDFNSQENLILKNDNITE